MNTETQNDQTTSAGSAKRPIVERLVMWWRYRNHPCYMGNGEFDHELNWVDDSFDHEYGTEQIQYMQCTACGATHDEDSEIPEAAQDYFSDYDYGLGN